MAAHVRAAVVGVAGRRHAPRLEVRTLLLIGVPLAFELRLILATFGAVHRAPPNRVVRKRPSALTRCVAALLSDFASAASDSANSATNPDTQEIPNDASA